MKTCERCGQHFTPKYSTMRLCLDCWIAREQAFDRVVELESEVRSLNDQLAGNKPRTQRGENRKLKARVAELEVENARLRMMSGSRQTTKTKIPGDILKLLVMLAHPDKHNNSPAATKATAWLLQERKP